MTESKDLCGVIIAHYQYGKNSLEIWTLLANNVHHVTVNRWIRRFNSSGSVNGRKAPGTRRTEPTKRLINLVKRRVRSQNARKSSRTMAKGFVSVLFFFFFLESTS